MNDMQRTALGTQIRNLRSQDARSVHALAKIAGVDPATWYRVEAGQGTSVATMQAILAAFGRKLTIG